MGLRADRRLLESALLFARLRAGFQIDVASN